MTARTLKEEKIQRDLLCKQEFGDEFQYAFEPDFYSKYKNLYRYRKENPFKKTSCEKFEINDVKQSANKLYFTNVRNKNQCDQVKGFWAAETLDKENFIDTGVCFVKKDDAFCSKREVVSLIQTKNEVFRSLKDVFSSETQKVQSGCEIDAACVWDENTFECISTSSREARQPIPQLPSNWPEDIKKTNFQKYLRDYYMGLYDRKPQSFAPLFGEGNRCEGYQKMIVSQPQTVVNMIFKGFAKAEKKDEIPDNRGLLVWHGTGSGKTCTAVGVMEAFWDTDKTIVYVSSIEALASNPPENFIKCAEELYPRFRSVPGMAQEEFKKRGVLFFTFAKLVHHLMLFHPLKVKDSKLQEYKELLKNAVLIIDEVHNIFRPLPNQKGEHFALRDFLLDFNNPLTDHLHIAVLTATPGNTMEEIVSILNLVQSRKYKPIQVPKNEGEFEQFGKSIKGLISYFNMSADLSKYPKVEYQKPHFIPMSEIQFQKYAEALLETKPASKVFDETKIEQYYKQARKYSNSLFNWEDNLTLREFSAKIPILLEQIKKYADEKHFVYSAFYERRGYGGQGILAIHKVLDKEGYEQIDYKTARKINNGEIPFPEKKKRYVLAIISDLQKDASQKSPVGANMQELVKLFNRPENKNGEYVQIFLATQKFNEGVDFKGLRNIHIFEPFLIFNQEIQTIGRGARFCSHKDLNIKNGEWVVRVHQYIADFPVETEHGPEEKPLSYNPEELTAIEQELESIKGKRGEEMKLKREELKQRQKELKQLANPNKRRKKPKVFTRENVFMIDQVLFKELKEKVANELRLLLIMKSYAIDCELFRKFHSQGGEVYDCKY